MAAFAVISWLQLSPVWWFAVAFASAVPLLFWPSRPATAAGGRSCLRACARRRRGVNLVLLLALGVVHVMARDAMWSPYYKITVGQDGPDTVVEVNNIFHQSMAPVEQKEYFYQWPYAVFGDSFDDVLILGAGSGTDVAAALKHGAKHVDAVEIDPAILRLGPRAPSRSPVHAIRASRCQRRRAAFPADDDEEVRPGRVRADRLADAAIELLGRAARELHVHAESFEAVRDHLTPNGVLVLYNYFREKWLVDRLANTAALGVRRGAARHVHEARAYLGGDARRAAAADADGAAVRARSRARRSASRTRRARRGSASATRRSSRRPTTGRSST